MQSNNDDILDYVRPSDAEVSARKKRSLAIAFALVGFVTFVFVLMLYKLGYFQA